MVDSALVDARPVRAVPVRTAANQEVPPHHTASTVLLTVLAGTGVLSGDGEEQECHAGDVVAYAPGELHGMRATRGELLLLATIAPRPGTRP